MRMMRGELIYRVATVLALGAALSCDGDVPTGGNDTSKPPDRGPPGIAIIAGNNITDTVTARPIQALTVRVRNPDSTRAVGVTVRFQGLAAAPPNQNRLPVSVASLSSDVFQTLAADTTDSTGTAAVVLGFSNLAAAGRVQVSVPILGLADTAQYTVVAGTVARVVATPADTQVTSGSTVQVRVNVQDTWGNTRPDPVEFTAVGSAISVSSTGLATATGSGVGRVIARVGAVADTVNIGTVPAGTLVVYRASAQPEGLVLFTLGGPASTYIGPSTVTDWAPSPSWNAAGTLIVYAHADRIYRSTTGGSTTQIFSPSLAGMTQELSPQVAQSAGTIFFTGRFGSASRIWRVAIDGTNPVEILASAGHGYRQPAPNPDGTQVAVVEDNTVIRVLDVGSQVLSSWSVQGISPRWSPTGDRIAYIRSGTVRMVNADGTGDRLMSPSGRVYNPWTVVWSPNGQWLLAHSDNPGGLDLIDVASGGTLLLSSTSNFFYPAWKP